MKLSCRKKTMSSCYKRVNFYDLCRLCAQNIQKNKVKIFEPEEGVMSHHLKLQSIIQKCLCIEVRKDDFLPKVICPKCVKQLEMCNTFREECLNSENMLSTYFKNYRDTDDFKKSGKVYIKDDKVKYNNPAEVLEIDLKIEQAPIKDPIKLLRPTIIESADVISPQKKTKTNSTTQVKIVEQLPEEMLSKVVVNWSGEVINVNPTVDIQQDLAGMEQIKKTGTARNKKKATKKGKHIPEEETVEVKLTELTRMQPTFSRGEPQEPHIVKNLTQHVATVISPAKTQQDPIVMDVNSSVNIEELRSDSYILLPNTDDNDKSQWSKGTTTTMTEPKSHACGICFKRFKRREHLYQHMKLHTGFRPYHCGVCNKTFVRKEHLLRHMVLHSGERKFACEICNRTFSRHDNLLKHIRTHNKPPSYTCDMCQKVFLIKHFYDLHKSEGRKCFVIQTQS